MNDQSYVGFADESQHNVGRYRGVGLLTLPILRLNDLRKALTMLRMASSVSEMKWNKVRDAKYRFGAIKFLKHAVSLAKQQCLRVDVLAWDTYDSRHSLKGRDDIQNLHRMYHHLFANVLSNRWPNQGEWELFPDENSAVNWPDVQYYLTGKSIRTVVTEASLFTKGFALELRREFRLKDIVPV